jgi:hypothetical protein
LIVDILHQIVLPQQSDDWEQNYSTKTSQPSHANEQSIYSYFSMVLAKLFSPLLSLSSTSLSTKVNRQLDIYDWNSESAKKLKLVIL